MATDAPVPAPGIRALAEGLGVETYYWDVQGARHDASDESLLAVMRAMGVPIDDDSGGLLGAVGAFVDQVSQPVTNPIVTWGDEPLRGHLVVRDRRGARISCTLWCEDGTRVQYKLGPADLPTVEPPAGLVPGPRPRRGERLAAFELPGPIPVGYHTMDVTQGRSTVTVDVFVAPPQVASPAPTDRLWGAFAPVYALPGGTGIGAHLGNLAALARGLDAAGGKIVATLPLLASYLTEPFDPSPYAPVSRSFWNELYIDLAALPELAAVPVATKELQGLRSFGHAANEKSKLFDYHHQYGYVRGILEQVVAGRGSWPTASHEALDAFLRERPETVEYARFRAFAERCGTGWHDWPEPQRSGTIGDADVDPEVVAFHEYVQFAFDRDLHDLHTGLAERGQRLYLDLPVGAHGDGFDTWKHHGAFAWGMGAGAPPDDFFAQGQNWGFPPLRPHTRYNEQLFHFRDVVRHHTAAAGILRLDHAMCLERLYWVPDGAPASEGVYVRYPRDAMLAIVAIESRRQDCIVVGEDLGTVSGTIRDAMRRHDLLGMYVAVFAQPSWTGADLTAPTAGQLASIDTHDTPTFAGWLHGLDIDRRHVFGQLDDDGAEAARAERRQQVKNLAASLARHGCVRPGTGPSDEPALLQGLLRFLGESEAPAMLVAIDDLVLERNPQNVPGTTVDRPNWVQRIRLTVDELLAEPAAAAALETLQGCRLGSHLQATAANGDPS